MTTEEKLEIEENLTTPYEGHKTIAIELSLYEKMQKELKQYEMLKKDIKKCSCWKEHKALKIIKEKRVNTYNLTKYKTYNDYKLEWEINSNVFRETGNYNSYEISVYLLIQEEFDLLKEVLL